MNHEIPSFFSKPAKICFVLGTASLFLFFGFVSHADAATNVYYSVGQNTTDHKTGSPTLTISGGVGTFSVAQTASNMGVGDKVTSNTSTVCYISSKTSTSVWNLITATGATCSNVTGATVNSIAHAFASLNAAVGGTPGASGGSYLNTANLVTGDFILNIPVYYDTGADTSPVDISGWTTGASNYIRIYTATSTTSEVNQSQRHSGVWNGTKYNIAVTGGDTGLLDIREDYVRIDGLQIKKTVTSGTAAHAIYIGVLSSGSNRVEISNNIVVGVYSGGGAGHGITPQNANDNVYIYNNIVYGFNGSSSWGAIVPYGTTYVYNNTLYGNGRGISQAGGTLVAKNNIAYNNTTDYVNTFSALSTHNLSKDATAPAFGTYYRSKTLTFTNTSSGTEDFHLVSGDTDALNKATDLSTDPDGFISFNTDIDGQTRSGTWDLGADDLYVAPDTEDPVITGFTIPTTGTSRVVTISSFTATDNTAVTAYLITESATVPEVSNPNWSGTAQATYTITSAGTSHTLYAWTMDAAENISASLNDSIVITPTATSCERAAVQTIINTAVAGDTILVPAGGHSGDCIWATAITIDKPLSIIGAGSGAEGTKLTTTNATVNMGSGFFSITGLTTGTMRISGFYFEMTNQTPYTGVFIDFNVDMDNLRIDNNIFNQGRIGIVFQNPKGLIDNNYFYNQRDFGVGFSSGNRTKADASWASLEAGTEDALFIEDNHFIQDENFTAPYDNERIGTDNGGKLVIRHNDFDGDNLTSALTFNSIMTHGSAQGGGCSSGYWEEAGSCRRGQSVVEIYDNTFHAYRIDYLAILRGSANLIYNNSITGTTLNNPRILFREEEYDIGSNWTPSRTVWPAEDQVHNSFTWNNTYRGHDFNDGIYGFVGNSSDCTAYPASCTTGVQQNRDYFLHAPCAAGDLTDAYGNVCTHGKSTFSNLNGYTDGNGASNSYPGDGTAYTAHGTMAFASTGDNEYYDYTPYTYPHPLRAESDAVLPQITAFSIPSTSNSLTIAISTFTATDDTAVTGYLVNESAATPSIILAGWSVSAPTTYTFASEGSKTLYAWAKDAVGNVSTSLNASVTITLDSTPPVRSAGLPSGSQSAGTTQVTMSLTTDESATCKYGTTANTAYASIATTFATTGTTSHSSTISGLSNGQSYNYYVRCIDGSSNANSDDYTISFSVASPASSGSGGGGFSAPYPTAPAGGFTATRDITNSQNKTVLHFGFGNDITNIAISDNINFAPASYINATSSVEWPVTTTKILYIKYCNKYGRCSNPLSVQVNAYVPIVSNSYKFYKNLAYRMTGTDVFELQKYLNAHGFIIAQSGAGSLDKETNYFGLLTFKALIKFQEAYATEILTPVGLKKGTGYFGPSTRAFVNK